MGKPRVYGNNAKIYVADAKGNEILVGEVDKFSAKNLDELRKSQPLGDKNITSQTTFKGYDLDFEGGKVDAKLAALFHAQDQQIHAGGRSPYFIVREEVRHFDGTLEVWVYRNVTLHGYNHDAPSDEMLTEKFSGFSGTLKERGKHDNTGVDYTNTVKAIVGAMLDKSSAIDTGTVPAWMAGRNSTP